MHRAGGGRGRLMNLDARLRTFRNNISSDQIKAAIGVANSKFWSLTGLVWVLNNGVFEPTCDLKYVR